MTIEGKHFIGKKAGTGSGEAFQGVNPTKGELLEPVFHVTETQGVDRACALATSAFEVYRGKTGAERGAFLDAIAEEIEALGDELLQRTMAECALPIPRLTGERGRTCAQLRMFANLVREGSWVQASIDRAIPDREPMPKPDLRRMLRPLGPVAVFGASNFPLAYSVAGGDTASALAAGCPVIVKAHPAHPGTSELVARAVLAAAERTGMPNGVFSMVHGHVETGLTLVRHPSIQAVGFTGSLTGGRALFDAASRRERPIPVFAEMGSVNPVFLMPSALAAHGETLASQYVQSLVLGVGQFCTNPGLVFAVEGAELDAFVAKVALEVQAQTSGVMLTAAMGDAYCSRAEIRGKRDGVKLLASGVTAAPGRVAPMMYRTNLEKFMRDRSLHEEMFGPAGLLVVVPEEAELLSAAACVEGQLTATLHAEASDANAPALLAALERIAGRVVVNGFPTGVEVCPSMVHGGPYPATTDSRTTSVGTAAIDRFVRLVCFQNVPDAWLPAELQEANPLGIQRAEA